MAQRCGDCGVLHKERPALSRRDNKTLLCPECGVAEALTDYAANKEAIDGN